MNQVCKLKKRVGVSKTRGRAGTGARVWGLSFFFFLKNVVSGLGLGLHITPLLPVVQLINTGQYCFFFFKSNELKKCFDISASQITLLQISSIYPSSLFVFQKNIDYDLAT